MLLLSYEPLGVSPPGGSLVLVSVW